MTTKPCRHAKNAAAFIAGRAVAGRLKYGHTLADAALSPAALVQHAREEAADLLVYLTALKENMAKPEPIDDLTEAVAAEMWRVYEASPIVREGAKGLSWGRLAELAAKHPGQAPDVIRRVGLDEARAAIAFVRDHDDRAKPARPAVTREAVTAIVTGSASLCKTAGGSCGNAADNKEGHCYCRRTIDALMALIEGGET